MESLGVSNASNGSSGGRADAGRLGGVEDQATVIQLDRSIARPANEIQIVRRHDDRGARGVDVAQQLEDAARRPLVQVSGRLVRDQDERIVDERARDRHALLLSARKLSRIARRLRCQPDLSQRTSDLGPDRRLGRTRHLERERTFASAVRSSSSRKSWKTIPSRRRSFEISRPLRVLRADSVDPDLALARLLFHVEELEDGRLAGAARTSEKDEFALLHLEAHLARAPRPIEGIPWRHQ